MTALKTRTLRKSGIDVTEIGMGLWPLAVTYGGRPMTRRCWTQLTPQSTRASPSLTPPTSTARAIARNC
jgi:hypothetical protein